MSTKHRVIILALVTAIAIIRDATLPICWHDFELAALWQISLLLSIKRLVRLPINPLIGISYKHFQIGTGFVIAVTLATATTFSYSISIFI